MGKPLYIEVFQQRFAVRCLFVLAIFIDEPDAIQTILTTVIADPKSPTNVFAPSGRALVCLLESYSRAWRNNFRQPGICISHFFPIRVPHCGLHGRSSNGSSK